MVNEHTKVKAICEALRRDLQCGRPSSRPLPSERALMRRFAAARETVRRALGELQAEGLVVRRVGKGTFPSKRARLMPGLANLADGEYPLSASGSAVAQPGCARPSIPNRNALTNLVGAARKNRGSYALDMWRVSTLAYDDPKDFLYARPRGMFIRIK